MKRNKKVNQKFQRISIKLHQVFLPPLHLLHLCHLRQQDQSTQQEDLHRTLLPPKEQ